MKIDVGTWFIQTRPNGDVTLTLVTRRDSYYVYVTNYEPPNYRGELNGQLAIDNLLGHLGGAYKGEGYEINFIDSVVANDLLHLLQRKLP